MIILDIEIVYKATGLYEITFREHAKRGKEKPLHTQRKWTSSCLSWVWRPELALDEQRGSHWGRRNVLKPDCGEGCATRYIY